MWQNALILAGLLIIGIGGLTLFLKVTLASMKKKKSEVSVYLKIMTSHLQLLVLTLNFDLDWPNSLNRLNDATKTVADVSTRLISFDCFLE